MLKRVFPLEQGLAEVVDMLGNGPGRTGTLGVDQSDLAQLVTNPEWERFQHGRFVAAVAA